MSTAGRHRGDRGSAVVEFVLLALVLLVPLVYVVLTALAVQRAAFALTEAAREAGRAYATAGSDAAGQRRAVEAVRLATADQGVAWTGSGPVVACGRCDYAPGSAFAVDLTAQVPLPLVPAWLCRHRCPAAVPVRAHAAERLDCFTGVDPAADTAAGTADVASPETTACRP